MQDNDSPNIKNNRFSEKESNNIFTEEEKNKLIYSCYFCNFNSILREEYKRHCMARHPGKVGFVSDADIETYYRLKNNDYRGNIRRDIYSLCQS